MVIPDSFPWRPWTTSTLCHHSGCSILIFNHLIYHSTDYDKQGIAAYESYDDSRLFNDGYMESLLTTQLKQEGVHVYVAKVKPFMKLKRDDRKDYSDLWFILEGRGANCGSVLQARCKCKGGRDGGCKHIAGAMYAVEDLLNTRGKDSVTSGHVFGLGGKHVKWKILSLRKAKNLPMKRENASKFTLKTLKKMSVPIHQMRSIYESLPNKCAT